MRNRPFFLTLVSLTPQTSITVGLGLGQPVNGVCQLLNSAENAKVGYQMREPTAW